MTEQPESPEHSGPPPNTPPPAGPPPYPYAYPPGPPGAQTPQGFPPGPYPGSYPPPPMPYGDYYPGAPMAAPRNGLGVAALIIAIIALPASCTVLGGVLLGLTAVVLGFLGRGRVARGEANNGGVALTGIILGFLAVIISGALALFAAQIFNNNGGREMISCVQEAGGDNTKVQECMDQFQSRVEEQTGQGGTPGR
jgi:hypothetical protein